MCRKSILLIFLSLVLYGCFSEKDASVMVLLADPSSSSAVVGEKIYFDVSASTLNDMVSEFSVTSFDSENGEKNVFLSKPNVKEYKKRIVCEMPSVKGDSSVVSFFFEACDNVGMTASCQRSIMVYVGDGGLLKERSGYMLYSPWSGKEDAFSFATLQTIKRSEEALADIYLDPMSENEDDLLCRLIAGTDIVFALSSSYDYAGATWNGLQVVLNSSVRTRTIENFATGDVILVGREEVADSGIKLNTLGVIRIMAVYDEEGKDEDRVVFNLKTL